jgi:DNA-binding FadR family transcriptional regulator
MPRRKRTQAGGALQQVQQQARALLLSLRTEIRGKEAELASLRADAAALESLGGGGDAAPAAAKAAPGRRRSGRVNWGSILQELPKQFKAADVRIIRSVAQKRPSEIFAAITRWIEAGAVKRKSRGLYERA